MKSEEKYIPQQESKFPVCIFNTQEGGISILGLKSNK